MCACVFASWGTFWCLSCTLGGLVVSVFSLWVTLGLHCGTLASTLAPLGYSLASSLTLWVTSGIHFGNPRLHLETLGVHCGVFLAFWGVVLDPFEHFCGKCVKNVLRITDNGNHF